VPISARYSLSEVTTRLNIQSSLLGALVQSK